LRIDRVAVDPRFVVQVRAGGTPGRSDPAYDLANAYDLADFHADLRQMAVTGGKTVAMIDFHHIAVSALSTGDGHVTSGGRPHGLAGFPTQVDAGMNGWPA